MMTKEEYKKELVRMWNTLRGDEYKIYNACNGVSCNKCPLHGIGCSNPINAFKMIEAVEKWSNEHPQKHKVSKLEFDILEAIFEERPVGSDYLKFSDLWLLRRLLKKGYFNAATSETNVKYYFDNCEVEEDV